MRTNFEDETLGSAGQLGPLHFSFNETLGT